ncbi:MAG TPA: glucoamylase family protein [Oscillospiraceae bacterium]|mgnify:CR=1 FL=1|nr:glucoamylase family protein [Oscillospiraceae bacterium]
MFEPKDNEHLERVKLKTLMGQLKNVHRFLKSCYEKSVREENSDELQRVIYNNYYILDSRIKIMLKFQKSLEVVTDNILSTQIGKAILNSCEKEFLPSEDKIFEVISEIQKQRYVSNTEFELLEWEFSYTVILTFSQLFSSDFKCVFSPQELIALLAKSDVLSQMKYIETLNPIENIYRKDPCGIYSQMDTATRRLYRERTAFIALKSDKNESEVAEKILRKAKKAAENNLFTKDCHVGSYIYKEYGELKKSVSETVYFKLLFILPAIFSLALSFLAKSFWISILLYFPIWEITKTFVDYFSSRTSEITYLPRMNFEGKISKNAASLLVISTVLTSPKDILKIRSKLKSLYFLCHTENLKICLLCDFLPSDSPKMPEDSALLKSLTKVIDSLNKELGESFNAVIRKRTFSKTENQFIGYERKRGAIEQLIGYIKEKNQENIIIIGSKSGFDKTKYLIALDYDTKPLMDTPSELISIAEHPLNAPEVCNNTVTKGYGIIAPKISTQLESSLKSPFAKLFGGVGSSSAYDVMCGNLYQDCFHESIFAGKGLINVDMYYALCYKKFPDDSILSHDILEGSILRTAFAGDIEFSDSFPATVISYFKRAHRWIRGDIQNSVFIKKSAMLTSDLTKNPLSSSNRFKLFDNVRRAVTPIINFLLFIICFFASFKISLISIIISILSVTTPFIWGIIESVRTNGYYSISRKYYSAALSQTKSLLSQMFFNFMLIPQQAIVSLDAVIRALWRRFVSKKKLLEWTTAAQTDTKIGSRLKNVLYFAPAEIICLGVMLFSAFPVTRFVGMLLSLMPFVIFLSNKPYIKIQKKIATEKRATLSADIAAMWQYYEDYANSESNFLPPDNVQFSPVYRICQRTSPTNIGMMLLSLLTAKDFDLIDAHDLYIRLDRTLSSVEKFEKYCGNLYNWYDTPTLKISPNPFISSVDSGNFLCCLVTLKEGLREYQFHEQRLEEIISRIENLIDSTDIGIFYNSTKNLFTIGIDPTDGSFCPNHYDMLMSESRMLSYFAIAKRIVPKKHWRSLARTMKRKGSYSGSVSYSGTMFEFFMPELLLKSRFGSLCYESLKFCIHCQISRARSKNVPFGISESAFYAFDNQLNYQYKAHGVQNSGIRRGLDLELVVSPYSTYLSMQIAFDSAYSNLEALKKYGTYGPYGHYEAVDFTSDRANSTVIKSYMAHHIGMSIVALNNTLLKGRMQERFMRDNYMGSASELLEEKVLSGSAIYDDVQENEPRENDSKNAHDEFIDYFSVSNPNVKLLTNGDYTLALTDLGTSVSIYQEKDVFCRTTDLLRRPQGCYFAVSSVFGTQYFTYLPSYSESEMSAEFKEHYVNYYSNSEYFELGMKAFLHGSLPCEFREFAVKNLTSQNQKISLMCYFEPILINFLDFEAHPAFMKLFLSIEYDKSTETVIITRRERNSDSKAYCAIGLSIKKQSSPLRFQKVMTRDYMTTI